MLDDPLVRIADTRWYLGEPDRGTAAYAAGHLPGAVFVDLEHHLSSHPGPGRHPLPTREEFAARIGALGFGDDHLVVAYDDRGGAIAARLWWMLRWIGHDRVRVLDGGMTAWAADGLPTEVGIGSQRPAAMSVHDPLTRRIDREELAAGLGSIRLFDARAPERYRGDEEPIDPIGGHIPTALDRPYEGALGPDDRFLPASDLAAMFGRDDRETVVYCGSGVTACHDILAMVTAGLPEPILYPGSWSDWSSSGMPVAIGPQPGTV